LLGWSLLASTTGLAVIGLFGSALVGVVAEILGVVGAGVAVVLTARRHRDRIPERARGWSTVAWGFVVFGLGVVPYLIWPVATPAHSLAELAGVPLLFIGLGRVRRTLRAPRDAMKLAGLDGSLAGTAGVVVTWMIAFEPFVGHHPISSVIGVGVFPLAGLAVLSYWILPLFLLDRHNPVTRAIVMITLSVVGVSLVIAVADLSTDIDIRRLHGLYGTVAVLGALALADNRCWSDNQLSIDTAFLDRERIALISASLAVIPVMLVSAAVVGTDPNLAVPGVGAAVMVLLVTVRLRGALHDADTLQSRLRRLAEIDPLTGLPNRRAAEDRLAALESSPAEVLVMFIDLDGFKPINDRYGHDVGDLVLREAARRLRNCVRDVDLVARFGGDEFLILAPGLPAEQAEFTARRIQRVLIDSYEVRGKSLTIGASIGVAFRNDSKARSINDLLELADQAMYRSKAAGNGPVIATGQTAGQP
jgi:diguanylate cyclase (GGDEF)-like protein